MCAEKLDKFHTAGMVARFQSFEEQNLRVKIHNLLNNLSTFTSVDYHYMLNIIH